MVLETYGRSSGFCIDPIEKKPLNHFFPGTSVLSFGTAGCNLGCKFCQNWDISKSARMDRLMSRAAPEAIARAARDHGCLSVAYTYNDPVIFHEYAIDTALACEALGIANVAVTAGYVCAAPRTEFYRHMDAVNLDLKAFSEPFYRRLTGGHLQPVLETIEAVYHETTTWMELTTLIIPGHNDSDAELHALSEWILEHTGPEVPLHFTAFHPDFKLRDPPPTPPAQLRHARHIALHTGLHHVYTGNVIDPEGSATYCAQCGQRLIGRDGYRIAVWQLDDQGRCRHCQHPLSGRFAGSPGHWGGQRQAIQFAATN